MRTRAAVMHEPGAFVVEELDVEEPLASEVVVRMSAVGVCGTDLHEYAVGPIVTPTSPHPLTGVTLPLLSYGGSSGPVDYTFSAKADPGPSAAKPRTAARGTIGKRPRLSPPTPRYFPAGSSGRVPLPVATAVSGSTSTTWANWRRH